MSLIISGSSITIGDSEDFVVNSAGHMIATGATIQSNSTGGQLTLENDVLRIYDGVTLRIKLGNLLAVDP